MGKTGVDCSELQRLPNVHFVGTRSYDSLPGFAKGFTVGILPFKVNRLTENVNPIKLREYLAAGLPVVSTALPEVKSYAGVVGLEPPRTNSSQRWKPRSRHRRRSGATTDGGGIQRHVDVESRVHFGFSGRRTLSGTVTGVRLGVDVQADSMRGL